MCAYTCMKTSIARCYSLALLSLVAVPAFAVTYQVGPTRTYKQITAVQTLVKAGDIVEVDGNATYNGVRLTKSGTATNPIIIRGKAQGAQRPVIDARGAGDGLRMDASHYVIEDLVVSNAITRCVYLHGTNLTLRRVVVHTCRSHGILGSDTDTGDMTLTEVEVYNTGNSASPNSQHHPVYIGSDYGKYPNAVLRIERSWIHDNHSGNSIKNRTRNAKIFYNWIETTNSQNYAIESIGPDMDYATALCPVPNGSNDATLCSAEIVGNVLIARSNTGNLMRLGSDGNGDSYGRYHLVNNTIVANGSFSTGSYAIVKAFGRLQSIEMHNNIMWIEKGDSVAVRIVRDAEAQWVNGRRVTGSNNLVTGRATSYASGTAGAAIQGLTNTVFATTTAPIFRKLSLASPTTIDLALQATSPARLGGHAGNTSTAGYQVPSPTNLPALQPPAMRPSPGVFVASARPQPTDDSGNVIANDISMGAYEYAVAAKLASAADGSDASSEAARLAASATSTTGATGQASDAALGTDAISSTSASRVTGSFVNAEEQADGLARVTRLYFAFLDRTPDYNGLLVELARHDAGVPLQMIAQDFAATAEFAARYGAVSNTEYVDLAFRNVLGRDAGAAESGDYLAKLEGGTLTRAELMLALADSSEFRQLTANDVFVVATFVGEAHRTPVQAELDFYVDLLERGTPREAIAAQVSRVARSRR